MIIVSNLYSIMKFMYHDLVICIDGYSAFFTALSPDTQDDIIARTEHVI